jgi:hypothetical protein
LLGLDKAVRARSGFSAWKSNYDLEPRR